MAHSNTTRCKVYSLYSPNMAVNVHECEICFENYDSGDHRPLFLTCGHTFGFSCIKLIENGNGIKCPSCRRILSKPADELTTNYSLIPSENTVIPEILERRASSPFDLCQNHGYELDHFCTACDVIVCKKCVRRNHGTHRTVFVDDILRKDPDEAEITEAIKNKIESDIHCLTISMSVPTKILSLIEEINKCQEDMIKWKELLLRQRTSAMEDLEAWNCFEQKLGKERSELFEKLCGHWKRTVQLLPDGKVVSNFKTKHDELSESVTLIEEVVQNEIIVMLNKEELTKPTTKPSNTTVAVPNTPKTPSSVVKGIPNTVEASQYTGATRPSSTATSHASKTLLFSSDCFPCHEDWVVSTETERARAISSLQAGRRPKRVAIVSWPKERLQRLPVLLASLGDACSGDMRVAPMDAFWSPTAQADQRLQTFIKKHGEKVRQFYGSVDDVVAISHFNIQTKLYLGIRLGTMEDIDKSSSLTTKPKCVCCIRSLPREAGRRLLQLKWNPNSWHFPDVEDGDEDWVHALVKPFMTPSSWLIDQRLFSYFLPRCAMSEKSLQQLLKTHHRFLLEVYCESVSLTPKQQSNLTYFALKKNITLQWTIPLEKII